MSIIFRSYFFAGALLAVAASASASLVNGSFEDPALNPGGKMGFGNGQIMGSGWIADFGLPFIISNGNADSGVAWHNATDGVQFAYLATGVGLGSIHQDVSLVGGSSYTLSFDQADFGTQFGVPGGQLNFDVTNGTSVFGGPIFSATDPFSDFIHITKSFVAPTTGVYSLVFTSVQLHAGIIDNVKLDADAVPEPASMAALSLGVAALLRKRKK
ncbi:MAG: PEP-CTERM sorting domain-containing protein [Armatimonadetes bacterium]|nr:PEP-CTERM sorting domain-containing protein [Armatimonadota bacterium]